MAAKVRRESVFLPKLYLNSAMKLITEANVAGKRVLVRVDFNVPLDKSFNVTDDRRIRESIPTLKYVLENGGSLVLMSHFGRPKEGPEDKYSLRHALPTVEKLIGTPVKFATDCIGTDAFELSRALKPGEVLLLENTRFHKQEEKGDEEFAHYLSQHGDVYVNDAFGSAHRAHASTAIVARYFKEKFAGFLLNAEVENANKVLNGAARPFTAIMGGAKVSDKIELIEQMLEKVDNLLIGGGMAYTFLRAKGYAVGKSLVEEDKIILAASLLKKAAQKGVRILVPVDSIGSDTFGEDGRIEVHGSDSWPSDLMGLDIGPASAKFYMEVVLESKTILWNGPMGVFEMEKFSRGTFAIADAVVAATQGGAFSLIGGGDSAAAIAKAGKEDQVSYVSTGGGALLEYMEGKVLPGVAALSA